MKHSCVNLALFSAICCVRAPFSVVIALLGVPLFAQTPTAQSTAAQNPGSISGTLTGIDGKALAAAITANGVPPLRGSGTTTSSANGSFTITNLPPGKYELCAQVGNAGYLDPCAWEFMPVTAQVPAGALTGYHLVVKLGRPLQVRINDPAGILTSSVSPTSSAPFAAPAAGGSGLVVGVFSTRGFLQVLAATSVDSGGSNRQITVPQNTPARLFFSGLNVQVTDSTGSPVNAAGGAITVTPGVTTTFTVNAKP